MYSSLFKNHAKPLAGKNVNNHYTSYSGGKIRGWLTKQ